MGEPRLTKERCRCGAPTSGGPDDPAPGLCADCLDRAMAGALARHMGLAAAGRGLDELAAIVERDLVAAGVAPWYAAAFVEAAAAGSHGPVDRAVAERGLDG